MMWRRLVNLWRGRFGSGQEPRPRLHRMVMYGNVEHARPMSGEIAPGMRLAEPEEPDVRNCLGETALHLAADRGAVAIARSLIDGGLDVNARDELGETPLHRAVYGGHIDTIRALLTGGADTNARARSTGTPLEAAALLSREDVAQVLIDGGARPVAGRARDALDRSTEPDVRPRLHWAVMSGDVAGARPHADEDPDVRNCMGETALHLAADRGGVELIEALVEGGANVDAQDEQGDAPLHRAVFGDHVAAVRALLAAGADPNVVAPDLPVHDTPLDAAIWLSRLEIMRVLIDGGANLEPRDERDSGPLASAMHQSPDVALVLLEAGADPRNPHAIYAAALQDDALMLHLLVGYGADLSARTWRGDGPVHAVFRTPSPRSLEVLEFVLEHGGEPDVLDDSGYAPLHYAAMSDDTMAAEMLLEHCADVNFRSRGGITPADLARRYGRVRIQEFLRMHGGR